ncbi:MAG TPA: hypothetical protein VNU28_04225, partial [Solirubrobacteraceae bacterium]|nr:hypothetical protein [Solirubrobacteraceae bacterium]
MRTAVIAGVLLTAIAICLTLTRAPPIVARSDATPLQGFVAETSNGASVCQQGETLPRGTTAIRLSLYTLFGPRVAVQVFSGGRLLTSGVRGAGWTAEGPAVPVRPVDRTTPDVKVCVTFGQPLGLIDVDGSYVSPEQAMTSATGQTLAGRMRIEYLRPGNRSWWSSASSVARRMGLGRWPAGTWIALLAIALMAGVAVATVRLIFTAIGGAHASDDVGAGEAPADFSSEETTGTQGLSRGSSAVRRAFARIPRAAWVCALIAFLNAACWSLVTPPFQVTDEPDHVAYVQEL